MTLNLHDDHLKFLVQKILFFFLRATHTEYGSSQAESPTGAAATNLHHSHSNSRSEPHLQPTP